MRIVRYAEAVATKAFGWIFARGDSTKAVRAATSETLKIVYAYAAALSLPREVADEAELPYSKPQIKTALVTAMGLATQNSMRQELRNAYLRLADWQASPQPGAAAAGPRSERVAAEVRKLNDELRLLGL